MDTKPIIIWVGAAVLILAAVLLLHLPQRMDCTGRGRHISCNHSLLSAEAWQRR
jgi:hypothetical protein